MGLIEKILKKLGLQYAPKAIQVSENKLVLPKTPPMNTLVSWFVFGMAAFIMLLFVIIAFGRFVK